MATSIARHLTEEHPARRLDPTSFRVERKSGLCSDRFAVLRRSLMRLWGG